MAKLLRILFLIFFILLVFLLFGYLMSSLDAGIMGIGILFLILALIDILRGEFKHNEKLIWIIVIILGIIIGIGGVVIKSLYQIEYETKSSLELLFGLIQLILFALYAIIGRKRKLT